MGAGCVGAGGEFSDFSNMAAAFSSSPVALGFRLHPVATAAAQAERSAIRNKLFFISFFHLAAVNGAWITPKAVLHRRIQFSGEPGGFYELDVSINDTDRCAE